MSVYNTGGHSRIRPTSRQEEHHERHPKPDAKSLLYVPGGYLDDGMD